LIKDALLAALQAGVPVGLVTFGMIWWALKQGYIDRDEEGETLRSNLKKLRKKPKSEKTQLNLVHKKWLALGGGFYGIVGLMTWVVVEWRDISAIILDLGGFWALISQFGLDLIIRILVEAVMNFVTAVTWPIYWLERIDSHYAWLWFVAAYAGYRVGLSRAKVLAEAQAAREPEADSDQADE
jgi:hypothetical protein